MLREEDYVAESTDFASMTDEALMLSCYKVNFGIEVVDRFRQLGSWDHLKVGVIARRGVHWNIPDLVEPVVFVNCDRVASAIQIPPDVWQHMFTEEQVQYHPAGIPKKEATPISTVKVIFSSQKAGFMLKAPVTLLMLFAQDRIPFPQLAPAELARFIDEDVRLKPLEWILDSFPNIQVAAGMAGIPDSPPIELGTFRSTWESILPIQEDLARFASNNPLLNTAALVLEIPLERIYALVAYISQARGKHAGIEVLLLNYVEECWLLHVTHEGKYISPSYAVQGQQFAWEPTYFRLRQFMDGGFNFDDQLVVDLAADWANPGNPRLRRSSSVGVKYFLNTRVAPRGFTFAVTWASFPQYLPKIGHWQVAHPPPFPSGSVNLRRISSVRSYVVDPSLEGHAPIAGFTRFAREVLKVDLTLIEWRQGLLLFESSNDHILVKVVEHPYDTRGYAGGLHTLLDLCVGHGMPLRVFSFHPKKACAEMSAGGVMDLLRDLLGNIGGQLDETVRKVVTLRNAQLLDVNLVIGDLLSNLAFVSEDLKNFALVNRLWTYIPAKDVWEPAYTDGQLSVIHGIMGGERVAKGCPDPLQEYCDLLRLQHNHPDMYAQLCKIYWDAHPEEAVAKTAEEEEDEYWENELSKRTSIPVEKVGEDTENRYYRDAHGHRFSESKDVDASEEGEDYYDGSDEGDDEDEEFDELCPDGVEEEDLLTEDSADEDEGDDDDDDDDEEAE